MTPAVSREAAALHKESVVIDLHGDTLMWMRRGYDFFKRHRPPLPRSSLLGHIDWPRMIEGGLDAQVFGLVTRPRLGRGAFRSASRQVDLLRDTAASRPEALRLVTEAHEILAARRAGIKAALLGLEGVHALEGRLEQLDSLARRGLRLCGLSHFSRNEAACPAMGWGRDPSRGLTPFGVSVVERCNELGVIVDLAHINKPGFLEAASRSRSPVVVSHTGVTGVRPHRRNIDDEQIRAVADTGGVVGIIFAVNFVGYRQGIDAVARHLEHVITVGGAGCAALGSDFDGFIVPVCGLPDVTALPRLTETLLRRGLTPEVIRSVLGGNVLRVLEETPQRARNEVSGATSRADHPDRRPDATS